MVNLKGAAWAVIRGYSKYATQFDKGMAQGAKLACCHHEDALAQEIRRQRKEAREAQCTAQ